jgi:hypothetical protein
VLARRDGVDRNDSEQQREEPFAPPAAVAEGSVVALAVLPAAASKGTEPDAGNGASARRDELRARTHKVKDPAPPVRE